MDPSNPFAVRDGMRQHVIDSAALFRGIKLSGKSSGIAGLKLDAGEVHFVGHSLGAILGTLALAVDPLPKRAVLTAGGAPFPEIFLGSPAFKTLRDAMLAAKGITAGSLAYLRLETIFNWILDPADPGNLAPFVQDKKLSGISEKKSVLIQLAGNDQVVPKSYGEYLARAMGVSSPTIAAGQGHSFLLKADPSLAATAATQTQIVQFLLHPEAKICTPNFTDGTCSY
jgi:pimeloyl-ACP methyl ester carboxylesterase